MLILGIDPGTAIIGFGLIETGHKNRNNPAASCEAKEYGCLKTNAWESTSQRLLNLHRQLDRLIKKLRPDALAIEKIFFFKNQKTIIEVSQARGIILLTGEQHSLPIHEYTPLQIKQALTGYGRAEKKQIQLMVKTVLFLKEIPEPDDAADALAIAVCCAHSIKLGKQIKN